jgi:TrmH family RNA methyltransferase
MARNRTLDAPPSARTGKVSAAAEFITSSDNRWLKRFRRALRQAEASEDGMVGIEGVRLVEDALHSRIEVAALLVSSSGEGHLSRIRPALPPDAPLLRTTDRLFAGVADTQTPQGIAALVRPRATQFDDLVRGLALVVVLAGVQDPGNVGTILRSAEAFGASGAVAAKGTAHAFSPKALRASAGSALRLPVVSGLALPVALAQLRMAGLKLYAASLRGTLPPARADLRAPSALIIGNEGAGVPAEIERSVDALLQIPIEAPVDSLNAAVAASVLLYEAARQRNPLE